MTFRKLFVIGAAVAALGVAGAAVAQTAAQKSMIDQAKAQGVVGEQADGYLGFRSSSSDAAGAGARAAGVARRAGSSSTIRAGAMAGARAMRVSSCALTSRALMIRSCSRSVS